MPTSLSKHPSNQNLNSKSASFRIGIDARMYSTQFTGIGRYVFELVHRLPKIAPRCEFILFMNEPEFSKFKSPYSQVKKILVNAAHYSLTEQTTFWHKLQQANLDLIHFTHFNVPLFYRKPYLVTIHDLTLSFFPGKKMTKWYHRLAYNLVIKTSVQKARKIIAVSKNTKHDLIKLLKVPPSKIKVIYEAVGQEFSKNPSSKDLKSITLKYHLTSDFILYTGVWRNHKNIINLLRAFSLLTKNPAFQGQLVLTGKEDPFYPEVKTTIKDLKLNSRIVLTGLIPEQDLITLYYKAKIFCLPSLYEGFGLSPLEAMACGTPVAVSNTSCLPEICGHPNALFFDPLNPTSIAENLLKLWTSEALQKRLRKNGLAHVKKFSWDKMVKETWQLYLSNCP